MYPAQKKGRVIDPAFLFQFTAGFPERLNRGALSGQGSDPSIDRDKIRFENNADTAWFKSINFIFFNIFR
jgi:hypothetical protein